MNAFAVQRPDAVRVVAKEDNVLAQEFAIGPSEADVLEHPVVELSELGAFLAAPAPFAQQSENVARGVVQREKRIALPGAASGFMPMDQ